MKPTRLHRKCLFSQALSLPLTIRIQVQINQKHFRIKMILSIQILKMYHLEWRVVTQLMAALILIKTQGKLPFPEQFNFIIGLKLSVVLTDRNMFS